MEANTVERYIFQNKSLFFGSVYSLRIRLLVIFYFDSDNDLFHVRRSLLKYRKKLL